MRYLAKGAPIPPLALAMAGAAWIAVAGVVSQQRTGHRLTGIIGHHYSVPEWGFAYRSGGEQIQFWMFDVPVTATVLLIGLSLVLVLRSEWRRVGAAERFGIAVFHAVCAVGFLIFAAVYWAEAAAVFI